VYHYYPIAYPVYYYPYPDDYVFGWPYFWGVTTFYSLGWSTHHVSYYQYYDYGHPYYSSRYCNRWYYRHPYYAGNSDWHHNDWNNRWDDNNRNHNYGGRSWNHDGRRGGARPDGGWHRNRNDDRNSAYGTWAGRSGDGRRDDNWTGRRGADWADRQRDGNRSGNSVGRQRAPLQQANAASPLRSRWADRSRINAMTDVTARLRDGSQRSHDVRRVSDRGATHLNGQRDGTPVPATSFAARSGTATSRIDRSRTHVARPDTTRARIDRMLPQPWQAERSGARPQVAQMDRNPQRTAQEQRFTSRSEVPRVRERPVQQVPRATQQRFASQQLQQAPHVQQQAFREQHAPAPRQGSERRGSGGENGNGRF
jgi:hypothetical protein